MICLKSEQFRPQKKSVSIKTWILLALPVYLCYIENNGTLKPVKSEFSRNDKMDPDLLQDPISKDEGYDDYKWKNVHKVFKQWTIMTNKTELHDHNIYSSSCVFNHPSKLQ